MKLKARRQSIKLARLPLRERPVVPLSVEDRIPKSLLWQKDVVVCHWLTRSSCHLPLGKVTRSFHFATLHVQTSALIPQQLFPNRVNILSLFYFPPDNQPKEPFSNIKSRKISENNWSHSSCLTPLGTLHQCIHLLWDFHSPAEFSKNVVVRLISAVQGDPKNATYIHRSTNKQKGW